MPSPTLATQLALSAFDHDKLRAAGQVGAVGQDAIRIEQLLEDHLGADGMRAVLSVPDSVMLQNFDQEKRQDKALLIRHKLVTELLAGRDPDRAKTGFEAQDKVLAFRPRMNALRKRAAHRQEKAFSFAWFRTGTANAIYGLLALFVLGLTTLYLFDLLMTRTDRSAPNGVAGALAYLAAAAVLWRSVRAWLTSLIEPGSGIHELRPAAMAGHVASVLVAGMTIIVAVLAFDYHAHTAAAEADGAKEQKVADMIAGRNPPWRVTVPIPYGTANAAQPGEDFGRFAGTFGDFFGGVVNPVLTFFTLIALLITLLMQRIQLAHEKHRASEAAGVSNLQVFETTFFNLLNLHSETIPGLRFSENSLLSEAALNSSGTARDDDDAVSGRAIFSTVLRAIHEPQDLSGSGAPGGKPHPEKSYKYIQEQQNHLLGHYFRNLFQVLAYVDRHLVMLGGDGEKQEYRTRKRYTNILRAQLSSHELCLLFFNCSGRLVDGGAFRNLLVEWEVLEHMPLRYDFEAHALYIEGFKEYRVDHMIAQYLGDTDVGQHPAGAFGSHPAMESYLLMREALTATAAPPVGAAAAESAQS